jgi:hypothetical protein
MRVEWCYLVLFLEVDYLDLAASHHLYPFFVIHHMKLIHHLQDQDQLAPFKSN